MNQSETNIDSQLEIRQVSHEHGNQVAEFLQPFMDQNFLLKREYEEILILMEHGFAAFDGEKIVGFAAVEVYSRKLAELQCLAVSPDYRRMGIAKSLVTRCCEVATKAGVKELLAISASDELFIACGFDYSLPNQKRALFFHPE